MEKRVLGKTGLQVPILSFGASSLGSAFRSVQLDDALKSVHTALDMGLCYLDTSPYYGRGISEVLLGIALADVARDRLIISTKLGRYDEDKFDFRAERVVESIDVSLHRLRTDYLDMVFCHDIEFVHVQQIIDETLPALRRLQQQGKVRFIGVAGFPLKIFRTVLEQTDIDVMLSYCHFTLQNRSLSELMPLLQQRGVGVVNASPFGMRLLTETGAPDWHPAPEPLRAACRQAAAFCRQQGCDIAKLALQFSALSGVTPTCLAGSASPENIRKWVRWLQEPYEGELIAEVEKILKPVMNQVWASGLMENND
jgi:aryl-alcohol dehydrogenase-like predicted oxidoreductase